MKKAKFNVMDCLIVIGVVLCLFGGLYIFGNLKETSSKGADTAKMRYTVEFTKRDKTAAEMFSAAAERGDICFVSEKERAEATLIDAKCTPAKMLTTNLETGETFWAEIPDSYDIVVTLESNGHETETTVTAGEGTNLKIGEEISVKGKGYAGYGFITSLEVID